MRTIKTFREQQREKLVRAATDEIYGSIQVASTGNYWINPEYNIFCEKGYVVHCGIIKATYYELSLEQYDSDEECLDCQVDYQDTPGLAQEELEQAIKTIIERNEHLWIED